MVLVVGSGRAPEADSLPLLGLAGRVEPAQRGRLVLLASRPGLVGVSPASGLWTMLLVELLLLLLLAHITRRLQRGVGYGLLGGRVGALPDERRRRRGRRRQGGRAVRRQRHRGVGYQGPVLLLLVHPVRLMRNVVVMKGTRVHKVLVLDQVQRLRVLLLLVDRKRRLKRIRVVAVVVGGHTLEVQVVQLQVLRLVLLLLAQALERVRATAVGQLITIECVAWTLLVVLVGELLALGRPKRCRRHRLGQLQGHALAAERRRRRHLLLLLGLATGRLLDGGRGGDRLAGCGCCGDRAGRRGRARIGVARSGCGLTTGRGRILLVACGFWPVQDGRAHYSCVARGLNIAHLSFPSDKFRSTLSQLPRFLIITANGGYKTQIGHNIFSPETLDYSIFCCTSSECRAIV